LTVVISHVSAILEFCGSAVMSRTRTRQYGAATHSR